MQKSLKIEISEIIVSFLALILVFIVPFQFHIYYIIIISISLAISFLSKIIVQKTILKNARYQSNKKLLFFSIVFSFLTFGVFRLALYGGFKKMNRKTAIYGVMLNSFLGTFFLMLAMFFAVQILSNPEILPLTTLFIIFSQTNFVFAISSMLPFGNMEGAFLYKKDKKTFWAFLFLTISLFTMFFVWYRFSVLYQLVSIINKF